MLPLGWKVTSSGAGGRGAPSLRTQVRSGRGSPVTRQLTTPPVLLVKVRLGGRGRSSSGPYESAHSTAPGPQQLLYTAYNITAGVRHSVCLLTEYIFLLEISSVSVHSAGAYTATLLVMVNVKKGGGRAPPTPTSLGKFYPHDGIYARKQRLLYTVCALVRCRAHCSTLNVQSKTAFDSSVRVPSLSI